MVCGSVAVNRQGARVGKGGGFSDLEFALLVEAGLIGEDTLLATTVHPLQVLTEALPETPHDFGLDLIVAARRSSAAAAPDSHPGSCGSTSMLPRSPPSPPWQSGAEWAGRDASLCQGKTRANADDRQQFGEHGYGKPIATAGLTLSARRGTGHSLPHRPPRRPA